MEKEIKERWTELYKQAKSIFSLPLSESEKMRERSEHAMQVYLQTGKIIKYEDQPDYVPKLKPKH